MSDARSKILARIRDSLQNVRLPESPINHPENNLPRTSGGLEQFIAEAEALSSTVLHVDSPESAVRAVVDLCSQRGWQHALSWSFEELGVPDFSDALSAAGVEVLHEGEPQALESIPVGITGAEGGLADTGTIIVRSGEGRTPLASLLPPVHIALLSASSIFPDMHTYWSQREVSAAEMLGRTSNLVFISGPSRTGDIEQTLTLGVHGPRELFIITW